MLNQPFCISIKIDELWKKGKASLNVEYDWKKIMKIYKKENGTW